MHMRKKKFPAHKRFKLHFKEDDSFWIFLMNQQQSYKVDLSDEYNINATFNISNIYLFDVDDD